MFWLAGPLAGSDSEEDEEKILVEISTDVVCLGDNHAEKQPILGSKTAAIVVDLAEAGGEK